MNSSDILIIGAGPGGYEMAVRAAAEGKSVTLVERDAVGGTCLNRGCIPTKALCATAEAALSAASAAEMGVGIGLPEKVDMAAAVARKDAVVASLREGVETLLRGVNVVRGEAEFADLSTVKVGDELYTAPTIVVATGSAPSRLPIPGAEHAITSDEALSLSILPASVAIIGGGVIGMEFASIFAALGVEVTVLEFCPEILPPFDADIAKRLRMAMKRRGVNIVTSAQVTAISPDGTVSYTAKGKEKSVQAECVLMAVGRRAVIPAGLVEAGAVTERGALKVSDDFRVQLAEGVSSGDTALYAIGDVNGRCMLAHAATAQGEAVLGEKRDFSVIPSAVFTHPECAMVGLTEARARELGRDVRVGQSSFRANGKAMAMGEPDGIVKVVIDAASGELLGCHICGAHAADLVQEAATVMTSHLPASAIVATIHAHPTLTETLPAAVASAR